MSVLSWDLEFGEEEIETETEATGESLSRPCARGQDT